MENNFPYRRPRLGISACLLGKTVRYDGGHKLDLFLTEALGRFVEWIPVCPEIEVGMGVLRETVRLVGASTDPKLVAERSGKDWTDAMKRFAEVRLRQLAELKLSGYVFKKNSPCCGMERVRVYNNSKNMAARRGRGLFAAAVIDKFPLLPVEEEGRLNDLALRENFVERSSPIIAGRQRWPARNPHLPSLNFTPGINFFCWLTASVITAGSGAWWPTLETIPCASSTRNIAGSSWKRWRFALPPRSMPTSSII
jgi:uncharacterized protein YbbK (DUF523 family)